MQFTSINGSPISGLVVFYDPKQTAEYKSQVEKAVRNAFHYEPMSMNEMAISRFTLYWVEVPALDSNDTVNLSPLQNRFQTMLANHEFPVGLRSDCFLYMDKEGLCWTRPYVWLGEPMPSIGPGADTEQATEIGAVKEEVGPLKVDIKHIAPTLFARLIQRDLSGNAMRWPYRQYVRADDAAPGGATLAE